MGKKIDPIMSSWIDHRAIVDLTAKLGNYSKIWAFANVLPFVETGEHCSIGGCAEIGRGSIIGNHVRISYGVFLPNNSIVEDYVFIGPRAVFTDDSYPVVENETYKAEPPHVEHHASIGAGAVILPGVKIGHHAMIGAGAVVTHDVEPYHTVVGCPAETIRVKEAV